MLPVVDRQLLPAGPEDHGDGRPGRRDDPARTAAVLDFWERAALAYRGDGTRQAWDTGTSRIYDDATVAALLGRRRADRRRRAPGRGQALQRHAREPPLPALLRHPRRLRRHRSVPGARRARAHRSSSATSTGWPTATSRGPTWPRTCRTTTSPPPSCSTTCRAPSPTSAPRTTRPRTTSTGSSPSASTPPTACLPASCGRCPPTSTTASSPRCARRRPSTTATSRPWTARREDPRRRLRVLHLPPPLRRDRRRGRRPRLDGAARPARAAVPAVLGDPGRERQHPRRRAVLRPLPDEASA